MNLNWTWMLVAPVIAAPCLWKSVVVPGADEHDALTRVSPAHAGHGAQAGRAARSDESSPSGDEQGFDERAWKAKLTQNDLAEREQAFDRAVDAARRDDAARKALEAWAKDDKNGDLAWTSRLALREADRRASGARRSGNALGTPRGRTPQLDDLRARLEDMQRQFGGLDTMFEDMQREMERSFSGTMPPGQLPGLPPAQPRSRNGGGGSGSSSSQSYSMQVGPDGVKVSVTEDVDGKKDTQEYTAKSLEELYAAHPELQDKLGARIQVFGGQGGGAGHQLFGGPGVWQRWFSDSDGDESKPNDDSSSTLRPARPLTGGLRSDMLGIQPALPTPEERTAAKLDTDMGVKVESVVPGTIASQIAIHAGDILVEMNGQPLKDADDVRKIMRERSQDQDLAVTLVDAKGQRRTLTWRAPQRRF